MIEETMSCQPGKNGSESKRVDGYFERLIASATAKRYSIQVLGTIGSDPIFFLHQAAGKNKPKVLLAAGSHGEEPAGCWGLLKFIEDAPS